MYSAAKLPETRVSGPFSMKRTDNPMYAVIKTGGKQYKVAPDDIIQVEKLTGSAGDKVQFTDVLMVGGEGEPMIGTPLVDGAKVTAELVDQMRARKIIVFKKKRRKNYRRTQGHRQNLTLLRITEIAAGGKTVKAAKAAAPKPKKEDKKADAEPEAAVEAAPETKAEAAPKTEAPKKEAPKKEAPKKAAEEKPAKAEAATGDALFETPDGDADDLKKISGVGPAIEKKLNALGITQYAQIAKFTKADIAKVDEVLNFKGRIERDDWKTQAKDLAKGAK